MQDIITDPEYLDVVAPPGASYKHSVRRGYTALAYVIEGEGYFDLRRESAVGPETLVRFEDGDELAISTDDRPVRILLISGKPIGEPVAWYGPIVMNSQEELRIAFDEYQNGTFLKHGRGK